MAAVAGIGAYIAADADKVSYISAVRTSRGFVHCCIPFTCAFASTGISDSSSYYRAYSSRNNDRSSPWHLWACNNRRPIFPQNSHISWRPLLIPCGASLRRTADICRCHRARGRAWRSRRCCIWTYRSHRVLLLTLSFLTLSFLPSCLTFMFAAAERQAFKIAW